MEEWWLEPTPGQPQGEDTLEVTMVTCPQVDSPVCLSLSQSLHRQQSDRQTDPNPRQDLLLQVGPGAAAGG